MVTALPSLCPVSVLVKTVTKDVEGLLDCLAWLHKDGQYQACCNKTSKKQLKFMLQLAC